MFNQFLRLTWMEFRIFLREPVAVFFNLFFPLMFLFLTMEVFIPKEHRDAAAINVYLPCFFVIIITSVSLFNVPIYIVKYRNQKFLKRLRVAPLKPLTILLSLGLANLLMMMLGLVALVIVGVVIYGAQVEPDVLRFIPAMLLTFMSLSSLGLLIASFCRGMRTVNIVGQVMYYPMIFLSGAILIPLGEGLRWIQFLLPASYGVSLTQWAWGTDFNSSWGQMLPRTGGPLVDMVVLAGMMILCLFIASKTFKWE
jgi:ABC-2 type transport system permease protein